MSFIRGSIDKLAEIKSILATNLYQSIKAGKLESKANLVVIREERQPGTFVLASKSYLLDNSLSCEARMSMLYLTMHDESKFTINFNALKSFLSISEGRTRSALDELQKKGYLLRSQLVDPVSNTFKKVYYSASERSTLKTLETSLCNKESRLRKTHVADIRKAENKTLNKTKTMKTISNEINTNNNEAKASVDVFFDKSELIDKIIRASKNQMKRANANIIAQKFEAKAINDQCDWIKYRSDIKNYAAALTEAIKKNWSKPFKLASVESKKEADQYTERKIRTNNFHFKLKDESGNVNPIDNAEFLFKEFYTYGSENLHYLDEIKSLIDLDDLEILLNRVIELKFDLKNKYYKNLDYVNFEIKNEIINAFSGAIS